MTKRLALALALLVLAACKGNVSLYIVPGDDEDPPLTLALAGVSLTAAEDTPVSVTAEVTGATGTVVPRVVTQGSHGTLVFGTGTSFTYTPAANYAGADTVIIAVSDDVTEVTATIAVTITPVNDPPALSGTPALTVAEDGALALSLANVPVLDPDNAAADLHVSVLGSSTFLLSGNEVRPFPDTSGTLTVPLLIDDGALFVTTHVTVTVTAVNDPPDVTVPAPQQTNQDTPFAFDSSAHVGVADRDLGNSPLAIELAADHGTLTQASLTGITFTTGDGTGDALVRFSGASSAVNAALNGLVVTPTPGFSGLVTLTITADDQGATGSGGALTDTETFTLGVAASDLPPFNTCPDVVTANEDQAFIFNGANTVSVADSDAPGGAIVEVTLSVASGKLTLLGTNGLTFLGGTADGDATLHFTGSFLAVNSAVDSLRYTPNANFAGSDTLTMTTLSNGLGDSDDCTITVSPVNDAPVLGGPTSISALEGAQVSFDGPRLYTVADLDAGTAAVALTIVASTGTISFTATPAFAVDTSVLGTTVLAGTLAQLTAGLGTMRWDPPSPTFTGSVTLDVTLSNLGNTGSPGALTDQLTTTLNILDPATANPDTYKTPGNVRLTIAAPGVLANDVADTLTVTSADTTTTQGGTVAVAADGGFIYTPPVGIGSRDPPGVPDTFQYVIANGAATGTVTVFLGRVIWFVDKDGGSPSGNGTSESRFNNLPAAITAAAPGPIGATIWVAKSATPYLVDVQPPPATNMIGSLSAYDIDSTDDSPPLPALGAPVLTNSATATPLRLNHNCRMSGFSFVPGATHTGPAILADGTNSGNIDNMAIAGFDTGIRLHDTLDVVGIDTVTISNAVTRAVLVDTQATTTAYVVNATFTNVGNGIETSSTAGAGAGFLTMRVASVTATAVAINGLSVTTATAPNLDKLDVSGINFTGGATATNGVDIDVVSGSLDFQVANASIAGFTGMGIELTLGNSATTAVNGHLDHVQLHDAGAVTFTNGIDVKGGAGQFDLTVDDSSSVDSASASGMIFDNNGGALCLNLNHTTSTGTAAGYNVVQSVGGTFAIHGYAGGSVAAFLLTIPDPGNIGTVGLTGAFVPGTCLPPPVF